MVLCYEIPKETVERDASAWTGAAISLARHLMGSGNRYSLQHRLPALLHHLRAQGARCSADDAGAGEERSRTGATPWDAPHLLHGWGAVSTSRNSAADRSGPSDSPAPDCHQRPASVSDA